MIQHVRRVAFGGALISLLAACGGGGGGGGGAAPAPGFTLSGVIIADPASRADSDTNDATAAVVPNNRPEDAQILPNPFVLNGYVNTPGAGSQGTSFSTGDTSDYFSLQLTQGQVVNLLIANRSAGDLDLYLYDSGGAEVASSLTPSGNESVSVPADGSYFIEVRAFQRTGGSASSYVLSVSQGANSSSHSDAWVPGRALVKPGKQAAASALSARYGARFKALGGGVMLMEWGSASGGSQVLQPLGVRSAETGQPALDTLMLIKQLNGSADFVYAQPDYIRRPHLEPNDTNYGLQWHYPQINLPAAWSVTQGSNTVIAAVIDTGVIVSHPDLVGNLDPNDPDGYDFISDINSAVDGDGRDGNADDPGDQISNSVYHGTHVAGTIAATTDNSRGVAGVGWNTSIMPLRALGRDGGRVSDVIAAIRYAAGLDNDSGQLPPQPADIINMSFGGTSRSPAEEALLQEIRARGTLLFASAGNTGDGTVEYPAAYDGVVSVAATNIQRGRASYSTFNAFVDVAAPGGSGGDVDGDGFVDAVLSASGRQGESGSKPEPVYRFLQGTSMASPHVAGVAALMKAEYPALTPGEFDTLLETGAITTDLGAPGRDNLFGHGLIDAARAVQEARDLAGGATLPDNPNLQISPDGLNFGVSVTSLLFQVRNGGTGDIQVQAPTDNAPWLDVVADNVAADGTGTYQASVDRSQLADGVYRANIDFSSSAGNDSVAVIMQVGGDNSDTLGNLFVLLLDAESRDRVQPALVIQPTLGSYGFQFDNVPAGDYLVVAGTDTDNDGFVCDAGEACGAYLTVEQPDVIRVLSADRPELDFGAGFEVQIEASGRRAPSGFNRQPGDSGKALAR